MDCLTQGSMMKALRSCPLRGLCGGDHLGPRHPGRQGSKWPDL